MKTLIDFDGKPVDAYSKEEVIDMLKKLQAEIDKQCKIPNDCASAYDWNNGVYACYKVIQNKINALKGEVNHDKV